MRDLAPCPNPFSCCSYDSVEVREQKSTFGATWRVACRECGLETPPDETREGAIAKWDKAPRRGQLSEVK